MFLRLCCFTQLLLFRCMNRVWNLKLTCVPACNGSLFLWSKESDGIAILFWSRPAIRRKSLLQTAPYLACLQVPNLTSTHPILCKKPHQARIFLYTAMHLPYRRKKPQCQRLKSSLKPTLFTVFVRESPFQILDSVGVQCTKVESQAMNPATRDCCE